MLKFKTFDDHHKADNTPLQIHAFSLEISFCIDHLDWKMEKFELRFNKKLQLNIKFNDP